ncbi:efflux RND transporter periplasmic adaptor subunit [Pseudomonas gingeri]|uniref:Efflux RND transporter periplasmic adaptor subunit n=1 Tax=Pseudomonas gingeri TaxID=117681 RepID=A0A7Y7XBR2_9PSED|nr:efflux RND transporter periplasmic adaptor subunit [Pseudomonas gingeri]NWB95817.1 efflux RND transporter periplasmic adaptor subunit [Pseudomonas gingeri]
MPDLRIARQLLQLAAPLNFAFLGLSVALLAGQVDAASSYDCLIEPSQVVEIAPPVPGLLQSTRVKRGDRVSQNQLLAVLESSTEQAAANLALYKSQLAGPAQLAQSKIDFSTKKFTRRHDMAADKLMPQQDSDDAEAELKQAQAELKVAKENREVAHLEYLQQSSQLKLRSVYSPFDGVVVDQMIWAGELLEPGATKHTIFKLAQLDPLRIRVVLPIQLFGKLAVGDPVDIQSELQGHAPYHAKVTNMDRIIDGASGTFVVSLDLANPNLAIPAGVKCQALFGLEDGHRPEPSAPHPAS